MDGMVLNLAPYLSRRHIKSFDMAGWPKQLTEVQQSASETSRCSRPGSMFVSQPQYEFPFPPNLEQPGSQHWRMVELTLHAPWFMLTVEIFDAEIRDGSMSRTVCIAWDYDLVEVLRGLDVGHVIGIVCMMPAWASPNGQWSSREVREVWTCSSPAGHSVVLVDASGEKFDCGLVPTHQEPIAQELVLRISPATTGRHRSRKLGRKVRGSKVRMAKA